MVGLRKKIIFSARAYAEKQRDDSIGKFYRRIAVHHQGGNMNDTAIVSATSLNLKAFKRGKSLELSKWYMGNLTTNLAESNDTNGAFFLVEVTMAPGNEPPPHVHLYEDELFYVLEGEFDVYVGQEAFKVRTGECVFLPRFVPHAFVVRSPRLQLLALFTPGALEGAFRGESTPAQNLDLPSEAITYSIVELEQTARRLSAYGVRFLRPDEIADQLPLYPKPLPPIPKTKALEVAR
jgi:quercetin dioxygenase-like cupin family protein